MWFSFLFYFESVSALLGINKNISKYLEIDIDVLQYINTENTHKTS